MLVQEERLFASPIEDERVAPLQPRNDFSFTCFLHEQITDRILRRGKLR